MRKISIAAIAMLLYIGIVMSYGQDENGTIYPIYIISDSGFNNQGKVIQSVYTSAIIQASIDTTEQLAFPSYVSLVLQEYKADSGEMRYRYGNSVFIDKENKLFITNAHVIRGADSIRVGISFQWYWAQIREEWINWEADLAIIRVDIDVDSLPEPACLEKKIPARGTPVMLTGYKVKTDLQGEIMLVRYALKGVVNDPYAEWGVYAHDKFEVSAVLLLQEKGYFIPEEMQYYLYKDYIHSFFDPGQAAPVDPHGLSGSALIVLTEDNCIGGISTGVDAPMIVHALNSPVNEIKLLWEKAKKYLESEKTNK